ncbi:MAG: gliding motility-associated C-terminal domain-containing protein [Bacteroidota bacterium]
MNKIFLRLLSFIILFFIVSETKGQFTVNAGNDQTICPGANINLGGSPTASGGKAPYTYSWSPAAGLSSNTLPNPTVSPTAPITYTVTVRDDSGAIQTDVITIFMNDLFYVNAGLDTTMCVNDFVFIGGLNNYGGAGIIYSWAPSAGLNDTTLPNPTASVTKTAVFTLTATMTGCPFPKTDAVTVTIIPPPPLSAGTDTTIKAGERAILHASGGYYYDWYPKNTLTYFYTANPNAEPLTTTTYYLYGTDPTNTCPSYDTVTVFVEPSTDVVFYNTFTPNNDGNNDTWYIGNISSYPNNKLEIFNRYGKLVYKTTGYLNTWDGKAFGEELPAATYFYNINLGDGGGKFHGTVTIIK